MMNLLSHMKQYANRPFGAGSKTNLACRLLLMLAFMLTSIDMLSAEVVLYENSGSNSLTIPGSTIKEKFSTITIESNTVFRVYTDDKGLGNIQSGWAAAPILANGSTSIPAGSSYYNSDLGCYEIPLSDFKDNFPYCMSLDSGEGIYLQVAKWDQQSITKVAVDTPSTIVDPFINEAASGCNPTSNSEEIARTLTSKEINLSGASLSNVKYARIYVVNDKNKAQAPSGLYSVSYSGSPAATATQAGTDAKNGYYIYNGSDLTLSDIKVTLTAGAGNFTKYKIVALLSNDLLTATPTGGASSLTQEPKWQEEYTYKFTYPVHQETFYVNESDMNAAFTILEKTSDVLSFYGKSASQMGNDGWYARWYIREKNNDDAKQSLDLTDGGQTSNWAIAPDKEGENWKIWLWVKDGNIVFVSTADANAKNDWYVNRALCHSRIYIPSSYTKLSELSNYEIVYEAAANYTGGDPDITLRYVWKIVPPITFEYDGTIVDGNKVDVTQQATAMMSNDETLDWTTTKASVAMPTTGWKYARFYVVDADGNAVDPTNNAHKLTVSGGTLCDTNESGYYIYNGGSDITLPTVQLTSTGTVRAYKVVCWLANTLVNQQPNNGTTPLTEEPDITHQYTYSFTYPTTHETQTAEVEWSPQSMTMPTVDVESVKGTGYLDAIKSSYYIKWTVVDGSDNVQPLASGTSRQDNTWTFSGEPYTVGSNAATVSNNAGLNATNWATWGAPKLYAPKNMTYMQLKDYKIVCQIYESSTEDASSLALTYTVSLIKTELIGQLKDGGSEGSETIRNIADDVTSQTVPLGNALTGCSGAKYARVWLTQNGTPVDPTGKLSVGTAFTQNATYGYYLTGTPVALTDATLTVTVGTFNEYEVHVALSADEPTNATSFARTRTESITSYEPDYDYLYTIKFAYTPKATFVHKYVKWNQSKAVLDLTSDINVSELLADGDTYGFYIKWYVQDGSSNAVALNNQDSWTLYMNNYSEIYPYALQDDKSFLFMFGNKDKWGNSVDVSQNGKHELNPTVFAPKDKKFEDYADFTVVCATSPYAPAVEKDGNNTVTKVATEPTQETSYTYYIFHFNADGLPPYDLVNETGIGATKKLVPLTNYESAGNKLDVSDALAANAKYARIYVSKYGAADDESINLAITYNGNPITKCSTDNERFGWYLSEAGGIDASKLSVTGLTPEEMLKYNVTIVSSSNELAGAKEPAWEKKTVYSFQKEIKRRILANAERQSITADEQADILTRLDAAVSDFSGSLYAKWYVLDPYGTTQSVSGGNYSGGNDWHFDLRNSGLGEWGQDGNILKYYTDRVANSSSAKIESGDGYTAQVAKAGGVYVPKGLHTTDYIGYQVVFEFSDEYDTSTNGADPGYKLKYVYTIVDPNAFEGELSASGSADGMTQEVSRDAASVTIDLANGAFAHSKLTGTDKVKYARFYLTDAGGVVKEPAGKLTVSYTGETVTTCNVTTQGYYMYKAKDTELDLSKFTVTFAAPKAYKTYHVVGVFSTKMSEVIPEDGATPLQREPDWELQYTYSFKYPAPATTKEYTRTMEWRRKEMKADASTTDPDTDWDTSWEELSLGQCVKWYVVGPDGTTKQSLVYGDSRQTDKWTIAAHEPFVVSDNVAMLVGTHPVTEGKWNTNWGKPAIYAPAGKTFEQLKDYKIICEVAAENSGTSTPNARYTFTMFKSYLGELKDGGTKGSETITVQNTSAVETINIGKVLTQWGQTGAKYARVWLTDVTGTRIDPTGKLTASGMTAYTTEGDKDVNFGYYVSNGAGISLSDVTLALEAGTFDQYQVHVALSTEEPTATSEPDYDYEYTFGFKYDMKTKYKTVLYDKSTRQCTPHLLGNWQEIAVDCNVGRTLLAEDLYVRWYLTDKSGNPIAMESLTGGGYTALTSTNGYYRYKFDKANFNDRGTGTAYNPTITLPTGTDYKEVRVVCVATVKTDTWNAPWTADPEEMQVKYVYDLRTADDLDPAKYPFVHYQGEGYRYVAEQGLTEMAAARDYTKVSGTTVTTQYTWNYQTNTYEESVDKDIRQNVHTVDYYYYLNLADGEEEELLLPLQYYDPSKGKSNGNDTEPRAYYRWYDWKTDMASSYLEKRGSSSETKLTDHERGFIALPFGDDPNYLKVGVKFKAPAGFTSLTQNEEILIACDVSRYLDGMDDSFTYLVHEPTISERYLFHILPASILAAKTKAKAASLSAVETQLTTKDETDEVSILENSGRIVVSTNNGTGKFSLRTKIRALNHYYVYNGSNVVAADYMQWYAYYKDETNTWWKGVINMGDRKSVRQANYTLSDISGATWTKLSGDGATKPNIKVGDRVEMVATVGNTAAGAEKELPIIWGELEIIDAAPQTLGNESEERTTAYMNAEYNHAKTLDFNDFFHIGKKKPENSFENYAKIPIEWPNAQYGFCYPQLYGLCATNKYAGWGPYGVSPLHGDYILLKSMNMSGISYSEDRDNQSILCQWWEDGYSSLFDVTHERASGKGIGNTDDYGAFLYVDAADEARTIAQLEFDAALCPNARLYYTAYVADMTRENTKPQLRFRVSVEDNGQRVPVVSFVTGDIQEQVDGAIAEGQWYQVYGYTTIPAEMSNYLDGTQQHFYVEIDNYCDNTNGADYCVDQISFFTQSAQVQVKQLGSPCDEGSGVEVKVVAPADKLLAALGKNSGTKKVFYRLFKKHDNMSERLTDNAEEEVYGAGVYSGGDDESNIRYSTVEVETTYDEATLPVGQLLEGQTKGYYKDAEGTVYYQFDDRFFPLEVNSTYFVSFYTMGAPEVRGFEGWGNPYEGSVCSTYSNYITPTVLRIDLESGGEYSDGNIGLDCGVSEVAKTFNITVQYPTEDGYVPYTVNFDFWDGSKTEFKKIKEGDLYLEKALDHFRANYPDYKTSEGAIPSEEKTTNEVGYTTAMYNLIKKYVDEGKLQLLNTDIFSHTFTSVEAEANDGNRKFAAIPVNRHVESDRYICSPLELAFKVTGNASAPVMELGFDDVTYPVGYNHRVVRLGLEQFRKMKTGGYKLHIPVARYLNKGKVLNGKKLLFTATDLRVIKTNDPTITTEDLTDRAKTKVADIIDPAGGSDVYVDVSRMYLPLDFSACVVDFHEGYYYEVSTSYKDEEDEAANPCSGDLYIVFKVVPEFVTWDGQQIGTSMYYSGNWYDDKNWLRSTRAELYKDDTDTHHQNTPTVGHPASDLYKDNLEINSQLDNRPGFVPMKFTYVTLLGKNHSPSMINEDYGGKIPGKVQTGGDLISPTNDLASDTSPSGSSAYLDDKFIRYDMLVRYGEDGCKGHRFMSGNGGGGYGWNDFTGDLTSLTNVFDCEKFYGNICKEIYFKPGAELRLQQRLKYEKAWVEEELEPNKWYLMSTPLKGTYAGDMYVPATAKTDYSQAGTPSVTGRQVTEAFQDINFDKSKGYSRTQYPIYQRSWNLDNAKVYTKTDDVRGNEYSAYLKFPTQISSDVVEWSHTYNDVQVPYNTYAGFAIRANRKSMTDNALIRLPKADTSYDYYDWTDTSSEPDAGAAVKNVTKGDDVYGRLVFDNKDHEAGGYTSEDMEEWDIPLRELQAQGTDEYGYTYYLVGNPFMASIDMGKFFGYDDHGTYYSYNPKLSPIYYIYKDGAPMAVDAAEAITDENKGNHIIRPLQAFIVKCNAAEAPENIVFNRWAITDGNYTDPTQYVAKSEDTGGNGNGQTTTPARRRTVTLKACSDNGISSARIEIGEEATDGYRDTEDATTLFDSNLSDVPVIFTVADGKAVSIDRRQTLDVVPFGVACAGRNELVSVECNLSPLTSDHSPLYMLDAVTGQTEELTDGMTLMVQPNDYGRYFLTTRGDLTAVKDAKADGGIVVSVRGSLVTVKADEALTSVRALTTGGATVYSEADCGPEMSFRLSQGGVYIIEAQTAETRKTVKIVVKD